MNHQQFLSFFLKILRSASILLKSWFTQVFTVIFLEFLYIRVAYLTNIQVYKILGANSIFSSVKVTFQNFLKLHSFNKNNLRKSFLRIHKDWTKISISSMYSGQIIATSVTPNDGLVSSIKGISRYSWEWYPLLGSFPYHSHK